MTARSSKHDASPSSGALVTGGAAAASAMASGGAETSPRLAIAASGGKRSSAPQSANVMGDGGSASPSPFMTADAYSQQDAKPPAPPRQRKKKKLGIDHLKTAAGGLESRSEWREEIDKMLLTAKVFCPETAGGGEASTESIANVVREAFKQANEQYGAHHAAAWGRLVPAWGGQGPERAQADEAAVRAADMSLPDAARARLAPTAGDRLSPERIGRLSPDNPERENLLKLAKGMPIATAEGFTRNGTGAWPPLRSKYLDAAPAVNRLLHEAYVATGKAFLVTKEFAVQHLADQLHLSPLGWAPKSGKVQGRPTLDASDGGAEHQPLNSPEVKKWSDDTWGKMHNPTIADMADMICTLADECGCPWEEIALFVMDLAAAYNLIIYDPAYAGLMASETSDGYVVVYLVGTFGWTGTPAAFEVVTRAIRWELKRPRFPGRSKMFVDDALGATTLRLLPQAQEIAKHVMEDLLGPGAVAAEKTKSTALQPSLTVIGYELDMELRRVGVARKNLLRAIYGFFVVDTSRAVPVRRMEQLASWGVRYAAINETLLPFTRELYVSFAGLGRHTAVLLGPAARRAIHVFRALLVLTLLVPERATRPMWTFRVMFRKFLVIEFDASLTGGGVLLFLVDAEGCETLLGGFAVSLACWEIEGEPSYQNTAEFTTAILGRAAAVSILGSDMPSHVHLRGDSVSALSWAQGMKARSDLASSAAAVLALMCVQTGVRVGGTTHLPAEANWAADRLSREDDSNAAIQHLTETDPQRFSTLEAMWLEVDAAGWLDVCNPRGDTTEDVDFARKWARAQELITNLRPQGPSNAATPFHRFLH